MAFKTSRNTTPGRFSAPSYPLAAIVLALLAYISAWPVAATEEASVATSRTVFTYRNSESALDQRYDYDTSVLQLALEKTRQTHGPFILIPSPVMNFPRAILSASRDQFPNFILKLSYSPSLHESELLYANFPVDLGIVGYRVCFTRKSDQEKLSQVRNLEGLRKFSFGIGSGWSEVAIFKANQLNIVESPLYDNLYTMLANKRYSILCRGANEVLGELQSHQYITDIHLNPSIGLYYPLPRFFYSHASNKKSLERINAGLKIAYEDGSLLALWKEHYAESIQFAKLADRHIIRIANPGLRELSTDYQQYFLNPLTLQ